MVECPIVGYCCGSCPRFSRRWPRSRPGIALSWCPQCCPQCCPRFCPQCSSLVFSHGVFPRCCPSVFPPNPPGATLNVIDPLADSIGCPRIALCFPRYFPRDVTQYCPQGCPQVTHGVSSSSRRDFPQCCLHCSLIHERIAFSVVHQ